MNIIELKDEVEKQMTNLHKELNKELEKHQMVAILIENNRLNFAFSIETNEGVDSLAIIKNFKIEFDHKTNIISQVCSPILEKYSKVYEFNSHLEALGTSLNDLTVDNIDSLELTR